MDGNKQYEVLQEDIVNKFVAILERDDLNWIQKWSTDIFSGIPLNATTNKQYTGKNILILMFAQMYLSTPDNRFCTFEQAQKAGWKIQKGAKSIPTIKYMPYDLAAKKEWDDKALDGLADKERQQYIKDNKRTYLRVNRVFNGSQIDGIPVLERKATNELTGDKIATIENIIEKSPASIAYGFGDAFYSVDNDKICLPFRDNFNSIEGFYTTALHEIAHSTGHKDRLNRDLTGKFGTEAYAKEELRAELASVFMAAQYGLKIGGQDFENHGAYLQSWLKCCKEDKDYLFDCMSDSQKIAEYVNNIPQQEKHKQELTVEQKNANLLYPAAKNNVQKQQWQEKPSAAPENTNALSKRAKHSADYQWADYPWYIKPSPAPVKKSAKKHQAQK